MCLAASKSYRFFAVWHSWHPRLSARATEANTTSKSLKKFKELFPDKVKLRVHFSLDNLKLDGDVLNIPLLMADQTDRMIGLALEQRK